MRSTGNVNCIGPVLEGGIPFCGRVRMIEKELDGRGRREGGREGEAKCNFGSAAQHGVTRGETEEG